MQLEEAYEKGKNISNKKTRNQNRKVEYINKCYQICSVQMLWYSTDSWPPSCERLQRKIILNALHV